MAGSSILSTLRRQIRHFLPRPPSTDKATNKQILTAIPGSTVPPPAPEELPYRSKEIRPTRLDAQLHPQTQAIVDEVHAWFFEHWPFKTETHKKRFVDEGFVWYSCIICPKGLEDRQLGICKYLTAGFLIDDMLDRMSVEEGVRHNDIVIACCRGTVEPDRTKPAQWMMYDLFQEFRRTDKDLADLLLQYTIEFFAAQVVADRSKIKTLEGYFEYRYADLGKAAMSGVMFYAQDIHVTKEELAIAVEMEKNAMKHVTLVNDIASFEKEVLAAGKGADLGQLCSAVPIFMNTFGVDEEGAMRIMWETIRELETRHFQLFEEAKKHCNTSNMEVYAKGLELQMGGNERWNVLTPRYNRTGAVPFAEGRIWG